MQRCDPVIPPALILLPGKAAGSQVLVRRKGSRCKAHRADDRFEGGTGHPAFPCPVVQGLILIVVQGIPFLLRHSQYKVHAVEGGCGYHCQHLTCLRVHDNGTALVVLILLIHTLLQVAVNGQGNILPVLRGCHGKCLLFAALCVHNGNLIAFPGLQPVLE